MNFKDAECSGLSAEHGIIMYIMEVVTGNKKMLVYYQLEKNHRYPVKGENRLYRYFKTKISIIFMTFFASKKSQKHKFDRRLAGELAPLVIDWQKAQTTLGFSHLREVR